MSYPTGTTQGDLDAHYAHHKGYWLNWDGDESAPKDPDNYYSDRQSAIGDAVENLESEATSSKFHVTVFDSLIQLFELNRDGDAMDATYYIVIEEED